MARARRQKCWRSGRMARVDSVDRMDIVDRIDSVSAAQRLVAAEQRSPGGPPLLLVAPSPVLPVAATRFWLFSAPVDLGVFLGSAVVALAALWIGARVGVLNSRAPEWTWVPAVLLIDVAHVWGTGFCVYFDTDELKRRPWLYTLVPVLGFLVGVALYSEGELVF